MNKCTYPDCYCHFSYQEEGSDNCPMKETSYTFIPWKYRNIDEEDYPIQEC